MNKTQITELSATSPEVVGAMLADRCYRDEDFRQKLIAEPRACLEELIGRPLPTELDLQVVENGAEVWNLALPEAGASDQPLSEEDMDKINAGEAGVLLVLTIAAMTGGAIAAGIAGLGVIAGVAVGVKKAR